MAKKPSWQEQDAFEQSEDRADTNAHQTKRQCEEPNEGPQDQDGQRQRPRKNEQDAPENEESEGLHVMLLVPPNEPS
jgi:hypothetical protein